MLGQPSESGADKLEGLLAFKIKPVRVQKRGGERQVDESVRCSDDVDLLFVQVYFELKIEVRRKQEGHTGLLCEKFGEPLDSELNFPFDEGTLIIVVVSNI